MEPVTSAERYQFNRKMWYLILTGKALQGYFGNLNNSGSIDEINTKLNSCHFLNTCSPEKRSMA
jgi:hypothetical protein